MNVTGEIRNLSDRGHIYFELHDSGARQALVNCALFTNYQPGLNFRPRDGQKVEIDGRLDIYEPRGRLNIVVYGMRLAGEGELYREFLRLKARLEAEGLFDSSRRKPLPEFPFVIGIVTSPQAAALQDVMRRLHVNAPHVRPILYPASVQGDSAESEIVGALNLAERLHECDVILLVRGGGSLTDLWCFNSERVARAIAAMTIPVVSGIGHDTDTTISDLAADLRAATPTAAADAATAGWVGIGQRISDARRRIGRSLGKELRFCRSRLAVECRLNQAAGKKLDKARYRLSGAGDVRRLLARILEDRRNRLGFAEMALSGGPSRLVSLKKERLNRALDSLERARPDTAFLKLKTFKLESRLSTAFREGVTKRRTSLADAGRGLDAAKPAISVWSERLAGFELRLSASVSSRERAERLEKARVRLYPGMLDCFHQQRNSIRDFERRLNLAGADYLLKRVSGIRTGRLAGLEKRLEAGTSGGLTGNRNRLEAFVSRLESTARIQVGRHGQTLAVAERGLASAKPSLQKWIERFDRAGGRLQPGANGYFYRQWNRIRQLEKRLRLASVEHVLERGFSIAFDAGGRVVRNAGELENGEILDVRFAKGSARTRVEEVKT